VSLYWNYVIERTNQYKLERKKRGLQEAKKETE